MKEFCPRGFKISILLFFFTYFLISHASPGFGFEKKIRNFLGMEFVLIPGGSFIMGSPPDEPHRNKDEIQHKVTISRPFYLQTTEVTNREWRAVMGRGFFGKRGKGRLPVTEVSWYDCMKFIEKLNKMDNAVYRLPTEAEWEYACRAGTTTAYCFGPRLSCAKAMFCNNTMKCPTCIPHAKRKGFRPNCPAPVASYPPNPWGLYDMHGNVWEWCQDWYAPYTKGHVINPRGPADGTRKVRRGGSWFKYAWFCRSANRNYSHPASRYKTVGFRLVREPNHSPRDK
ncbi:MAG TPA: formylglycine-generating enzyme family protein [Desulfobacterales bacterium]|nr:formylglycine-generating enzyme family protein [Desulfobacterales bacterium]